MQSKFRRTDALACAGAVVFGALAVAAGTQADAQQTPLDQLIGQPTPGLAANTGYSTYGSRGAYALPISPS